MRIGCWHAPIIPRTERHAFASEALHPFEQIRRPGTIGMEYKALTGETLMRRAFIVVPFVLLINAALPAFDSVAHGGFQAGALEPKASVGLKPLTEMTANDRYKGEDGGLYGGGKNEPPEAHLKAARSETMKIEPLDANGKQATNGTIALVSISMSNATQEFALFKQLADQDPKKSAHVTLVDC